MSSKLATWRRENPEKVAAQRKRAYESRRNDPVRWAALLEWFREARKKAKAERAAYDKRRPSQKMRARQAIRDRVYRGRIERQPCEKCSKPNAQGHHDDYSKPLAVRWLCSTCHGREHRRVYI